MSSSDEESPKRQEGSINGVDTKYLYSYYSVESIFNYDVSDWCRVVKYLLNIHIPVNITVDLRYDSINYGSTTLATLNDHPFGHSSMGDSYYFYCLGAVRPSCVTTTKSTHGAVADWF
ncbi:hypothetical protein DFA_12249 [Cavenderia fasciculata]|uniref:Uncharacterized protein n=1 Tax=Cavenderia fasciculata TaxID=261658 RepID=F4QCV2_CACFS|nr:uncharacterized protein DFA_12249 [Cavenderia fasciculata]EGG14476.1 hypothetical protein DFA_12249 [Cavenderia fasciculata]|eukprot:XP_004353885.1 hypothetical protein DFA_12249 [Cavenderia fasciculata]